VKPGGDSVAGRIVGDIRLKGLAAGVATRAAASGQNRGGGGQWAARPASRSLPATGGGRGRWRRDGVVLLCERKKKDGRKKKNRRD
jgi:hypothetical protein